MKLYTYPVTTNALKVTVLIEYLKPFVDLNIQQELVQIHKREQQESAFLKVNPKGQIPVLVDDKRGQRVTESNAILLYLINLLEVKRVPELSGFSQQSDVMSWLFWQASDSGLTQSGYHFNRILLPAWGVNRTFKPENKQEEKFHHSCQVLDQHLAKQAYLCGDEVSIADMSVAAPVMYYQDSQMPILKYPNLMAWINRLEACAWWSSTKLSADQFLDEMKAHSH